MFVTVVDKSHARIERAIRLANVVERNEWLLFPSGETDFYRDSKNVLKVIHVILCCVRLESRDTKINAVPKRSFLGDSTGGSTFRFAKHSRKIPRNNIER